MNYKKESSNMDTVVYAWNRILDKTGGPIVFKRRLGLFTIDDIKAELQGHPEIHPQTLNDIERILKARAGTKDEHS